MSASLVVEVLAGSESNDTWDRQGKTIAILGPPTVQRDELFLKLLSSSLEGGSSLVFHSKPFVRAERLYELIGHREDLLSRVFFHHVPTLEAQEDVLMRVDVTLARIGANNVFFDAPSDNYLVSLALAASSPPKLKFVNASIVRQFAYLREVSAEMNANVVVTVGSQSGINTVEQYLLRYWADEIIKVPTRSQWDAPPEFQTHLDARNPSTRNATSDEYTLTSARKE